MRELITGVVLFALLIVVTVLGIVETGRELFYPVWKALGG